MAMDKDILKTLIISKMAAIRETPEFEIADATEKGELIWGGVAEALIEHITTTAQISFRTTDLGIQNSTAPGAPTAAPLVLIKLLAGQIS